MIKPTLVVMAAGIGSRYGGLKQVDPVGPSGEYIIDYLVYDALQTGFGKVVFVINRSNEGVFREKIGDVIDRQCETAYVFQELADVPEGVQIPVGRRKPWGTGQATLLCRPVIDEPFAVLNADDFYGWKSFQRLHDFLVTAKDGDEWGNYALVGFVLKNTLTEHGYVARGVCAVDPEGYLVEIHERTRIEKFGEKAKYSEDEGQNWVELSMDSPVSMNMWGFTPGIFNELETKFKLFFQETKRLDKAEFYLPVVVGALVQEGKAHVKVLSTDDRWVGVTYRQDKPDVENHIVKLVQRGDYPERLWE